MLQDVFLKHPHQYFSLIILNSNGGDVFASMQIGRLIRKKRLTTAVPINARCLSSCALVYIAGLSRVNVGTIGLHRPYLAVQSKSEVEIENAVVLMNSSVRDYVAQMGITGPFYEIIANTPPESMKVFRRREILAIVSNRDPIDEEKEVGDEARQRGITTGAYRKRVFDAQEDCTSTSAMASLYECVEAGTCGLSRSEYKRRFDASATKCTFSQSDRKAMHEWASGGRPIEENAKFLRHEQCVRSVMAGQ